MWDQEAYSNLLGMDSVRLLQSSCRESEGDKNQRLGLTLDRTMLIHSEVASCQQCVQMAKMSKKMERGL